tara:strand:+ start:156 stop:479 length:324 start_codon:yes stop_codon:yes gene_type:complete
MSLLTSRFNSNNHNLYFSKKELTKILNLYSSGVSSGSWKDYAIDFEKNNAFFYFFKHSNSTPECIVNKSVVKKKIILYKLKTSRNEKRFENIDILISFLRRKNLKIV